MSNEAIVVLLAVLLSLFIIYTLFVKPKASPEPAQRTKRPSPTPSGDSRKTRFNWLVSYDKEGEMEHSYHVGSRTITIGRGVGNFIQIVDDETSRVHCQLFPSAASLQIKDMGSGNGTFVNEEPVTLQTLDDGDMIRIGATTFVYQRIGDFKVNHALSRRSAAVSVAQETKIGEIGTISEMIREVLKESAGDVEVAARESEMSVDTFLKMCSAEGIDPDDFKP